MSRGYIQNLCREKDGNYVIQLVKSTVNSSMCDYFCTLLAQNQLSDRF